MRTIKLTNIEQSFKDRLMKFGSLTICWQWVFDTFEVDNQVFSESERDFLREHPSEYDDALGYWCAWRGLRPGTGKDHVRKISQDGVDWYVRWLLKPSEYSFRQTRLFFIGLAKKKLEQLRCEFEEMEKDKEMMERQQTEANIHRYASSGFLYVLKVPHPTCGFAYKIGQSRNLAGRMSGYLTHNPVDVETVYAWRVLNVIELEALLHQKFQSKRIHKSRKREWFALNEEEVKIIPQLVEPKVLHEV